MTGTVELQGLYRMNRLSPCIAQVEQQFVELNLGQFLEKNYKKPVLGQK